MSHRQSPKGSILTTSQRRKGQPFVFWDSKSDPTGRTRARYEYDEASGMFNQIQGGGSHLYEEEDIPISPRDILSILAKHHAWQELKEQYDSLDPEYRQLLPEPEEPEIHVLTEPMNRYIDEFADEDLVEEARNAVDLLSPDDMESLFNDGEPMSRIVPQYALALPQTKEEWIPVMVKADILRRYM
jgi:hypothetical protein